MTPYPLWDSGIACWPAQPPTSAMRARVRQGRRKGPPQEVLLPFLQVLLELAEWEAVDHTPLLDPGPPRLRDAVLHEAQSPLVVGLGEQENYVASAIQALLGETREFLVVEKAR